MTSTRAALAALVTCTTALALMGASAPAPYPPASHGDRWPGGTVRTVGKLVAKLPGDQVESCSAAIVDSPSGSVVATAAHCIASPERPRRPLAMYFQPAYEGTGASGDASGKGSGSATRASTGTAAAAGSGKGDGPKYVLAHGWKVASWKTAPGWDTDKDLESVLPYDWAFLRMQKRGGRTIQDVYGANKLRTEPVGSGTTATLGYPASSPYDGETLRYCSGKAHRYGRGEIAAANVGALSLRPCRLTQGVSGGPWLRGIDKRRGAGTLVAVTSVGSDDELLGRPFPKSARALLADFGAVR